MFDKDTRDNWDMPEYTWLVLKKLMDPRRGEYLFVVCFDRMNNKRPMYHLINFSKTSKDGFPNSEIGHKIEEYQPYHPTEQDEEAVVRVIFEGLYWTWTR
jgi:hypothetical protein